MAEFFNVTIQAMIGGATVERMVREGDIVEWAERETDDALENVAGIDLIEDAGGTLRPERDWQPGELFETAVAVLRRTNHRFDVEAA